MTGSNFFNTDFHSKIRSSFHYLEKDIFGENRLFFENAGGSLRLKQVVEEDAKYQAIPDCPERTHKASKELRFAQQKGIEDIRLFLNAKDGSIIPSSTASKVMFEMVQTIVEHVPGTNIVTTAIEHPSSFDACEMYAKKMGKELRVAQPNPKTGSVEINEIVRLIDQNTSLLSFVLTSNITGAIHDIEQIIKKARKIKPELYIVVDAVQYAPHGVIDVAHWEVDGLNIAPYKMFGNRGMAYAYVSDRTASLPHPRVLATSESNWEVGSPSAAHYAGFSRIIDYICSIGALYTHSQNRRELIVEGMRGIHQQEQALIARIIEGSDHQKGLKEMKGVNLHFTEQKQENRDLIIAISFDRLTCTEAVAKYGELGVLVYDRLSSSFYSKRILNAVGLIEIVRVSPLHCHTIEEVDEFLRITEKIAHN